MPDLPTPGDELEERLQRTFLEKADVAHVPEGLAASSRRRATRRRSRLIGAGGAFGVAAVLATVAVIPALTSSNDDPPPAAIQPTAESELLACVSQDNGPRPNTPTIAELADMRIEHIRLCRFTNPSTGNANADSEFTLTDETDLSGAEIADVQAGFAAAEAAQPDCLMADSPPPVSYTVRLQDDAGTVWSVSVPADACLGFFLDPHSYMAPQLPPLLDTITFATADLSEAHPVSQEELVRNRWVPTVNFAADADTPFVSFDVVGDWVASDGCNEIHGTYELSEDGGFRSTQGGSTLVGCRADWTVGTLDEVDRLLLDGPLLVGVNDQGDEVLRFRNASAHPYY